MIYYNKLIDLISIVKRAKKVVDNYFVGTRKKNRVNYNFILFLFEKKWTNRKGGCQAH